MKVAEIKAELDAKGIKYTSRMRKAELESLLHDANEAEITEVAATTVPELITQAGTGTSNVLRRDFPMGGNVGSIRAMRRRQPAARARQARRRQIKRYLRSQGEDVCMNPGTRPRNKGKRS